MNYKLNKFGIDIVANNLAKKYITSVNAVIIFKALLITCELSSCQTEKKLQTYTIKLCISVEEN